MSEWVYGTLKEGYQELEGVPRSSQELKDCGLEDVRSPVGILALVPSWVLGLHLSLSTAL